MASVERNLALAIKQPSSMCSEGVVSLNERHMDGLMERLQSKASQFKSWTENAKAVRVALVDKRYVLDAGDRSQLQKCLDTLQKSIKVTSLQSMVERLESISRQLGLKFTAGPSGTDCFISSDMFYVEVLLETTGAVNDVKIAHHGDPLSCPELHQVLSKSDFAEFTEHLEGLSSIYQLNADKKQKSKAYMALQALETDLTMLSQLQSSINDPCNLVHKSPVGILQTRRGGHAMKLTYFISPYDLLDMESKALIPLTVDAVIEKQLGYSVMVCIESSATHKLQTQSLMSIARTVDGKSLPSFAAPTNLNSTTLPANFVLRLDKPMPLATALVRKIQAVTHIDCADFTTNQPLLSLITQQASEGEIGTHSCGLFVTLPDQHHCYFLNGVSDLQGVLVSSIPFTHPTHVPQILIFLRQQALFNVLIGSCIRPCSKQDLETALMFEVSALSWLHVTVAFEHPLEESMATAELDLSDITNVKCKMHTMLSDLPICTDDYASKVVQRCLSIPITMRALIHKAQAGQQQLYANQTNGDQHNMISNGGGGSGSGSGGGSSSSGSGSLMGHTSSFNGPGQGGGGGGGQGGTSGSSGGNNSGIGASGSSKFTSNDFDVKGSVKLNQQSDGDGVENTNSGVSVSEQQASTSSTMDTAGGGGGVTSSSSAQSAPELFSVPPEGAGSLNNNNSSLLGNSQLPQAVPQQQRAQQAQQQQHHHHHHHHQQGQQVSQGKPNAMLMTLLNDVPQGQPMVTSSTSAAPSTTPTATTSTSSSSSKPRKQRKRKATSIDPPPASSPRSATGRSPKNRPSEDESSKDLPTPTGSVVIGVDSLMNVNETSTTTICDVDVQQQQQEFLNPTTAAVVQNSSSITTTATTELFQVKSEPLDIQMNNDDDIRLGDYSFTISSAYGSTIKLQPGNSPADQRSTSSANVNANKDASSSSSSSSMAICAKTSKQKRIKVDLTSASIKREEREIPLGKEIEKIPIVLDITSGGGDNNNQTTTKATFQDIAQGHGGHAHVQLMGDRRPSVEIIPLGMGGGGGAAGQGPASGSNSGPSTPVHVTATTTASGGMTMFSTSIKLSAKAAVAAAAADIAHGGVVCTQQSSSSGSSSSATTTTSTTVVNRGNKDGLLAGLASSRPQKQQQHQQPREIRRSASEIISRKIKSIDNKSKQDRKRKRLESVDGILLESNSKPPKIINVITTTTPISTTGPSSQSSAAGGAASTLMTSLSSGTSTMTPSSSSSSMTSSSAITTTTAGATTTHKLMDGPLTLNVKPALGSGSPSISVSVTKTAVANASTTSSSGAIKKSTVTSSPTSSSSSSSSSSASSSSSPSSKSISILKPATNKGSSSKLLGSSSSAAGMTSGPMRMSEMQSKLSSMSPLKMQNKNKDRLSTSSSLQARSNNATTMVGGHGATTTTTTMTKLPTKPATVKLKQLNLASAMSSTSTSSSSSSRIPGSPVHTSGRNNPAAAAAAVAAATVVAMSQLSTSGCNVSPSGGGGGSTHSHCALTPAQRANKLLALSKKASLSSVIDRLVEKSSSSKDGSATPTTTTTTSSKLQKMTTSVSSSSSSSSALDASSAAATSKTTASADVKKAEFTVKPSSQGIKLTVTKTHVQSQSAADQQHPGGSTAGESKQSPLTMMTSSSSSKGASRKGTNSPNSLSKIVGSATGLKPGVNSGPASKKNATVVIGGGPTGGPKISLTPPPLLLLQGQSPGLSSLAPSFSTAAGSSNQPRSKSPVSMTTTTTPKEKSSSFMTPLSSSPSHAVAVCTPANVQMQSSKMNTSSGTLSPKMTSSSSSSSSSSKSSPILTNDCKMISSVSTAKQQHQDKAAGLAKVQSSDGMPPPPPPPLPLPVLQQPMSSLALNLPDFALQPIKRLEEPPAQHVGPLIRPFPKLPRESLLEENEAERAFQRLLQAQSSICGAFTKVTPSSSSTSLTAPASSSSTSIATSTPATINLAVEGGHGPGGGAGSGRTTPKLIDLSPKSSDGGRNTPLTAVLAYERTSSAAASPSMTSSITTAKDNNISLNKGPSTPKMATVETGPSSPPSSGGQLQLQLQLQPEHGSSSLKSKPAASGPSSPMCSKELGSLSTSSSPEDGLVIDCGSAPSNATSSAAASHVIHHQKNSPNRLPRSSAVPDVQLVKTLMAAADARLNLTPASPLSTSTSSSMSMQQQQHSGKSPAQQPSPANVPHTPLSEHSNPSSVAHSSPYDIDDDLMDEALVGLGK